MNETRKLAVAFEMMKIIPLSIDLYEKKQSDIIIDLQNEINQIKKSISWKITKPLRFINMLFKQKQ